MELIDGCNIVAEIVVGTYQEFVLGFQLLEKGEEESFVIKQSFTNHSHCGSIRAVSTLGKYIVSGSADEVVRIFNLATRTEHGTLQQQNGTITCLVNYESSYLFSGSEDGSICIWKTGNWQCEKTLKGHQGGVVDLAVHPSGKLALSVSKDKTLRTWNLVKGRCGYITNLKVVAECVQWSPEGGFYAIGLSNKVDICAVLNAQVVYSVSFGRRVTSICFLSERIVLVSGDKEEIEVHNIKKKTKLQTFKAHKTRVKDMKFLSSKKLLVTASSDNYIKVWDFRKKKEYTNPPALVAQVDSSCRITCLTLWESNPPEGQAESNLSVMSEGTVVEEIERSEQIEKTEHTLPKKKRKIKSEEPSPDFAVLPITSLIAEKKQKRKKSSHFT